MSSEQSSTLPVGTILDEKFRVTREIGRGGMATIYEAENIGEFEARMKDYATNEAFRSKMKGYTDLYVTGSREILQVT